mgnify:CR=1 FL=1
MAWGHALTSEVRDPNELDERRWRLYVLFAVITGCVLVLVVRLVYIQVIQHQHFLALAAAERWHREVTPARRGTIRDASGVPLATTVPYEAAYANTSQIGDPGEVSRLLGPILGVAPADLEPKLRTRQDGPVLIQRDLPAEVADRVRALRAPGISLRRESRRVHPEGNLAAQLLGVVGVDGQGLSGLEAALDADLAGKPGWVLAERDTGGDEIALGPREATPPVDGADVILTVDRHVQQIVERELTAALEQRRAKGGTVVVLEVRTGAVLALASRPTLRYDDPHLFEESKLPLYRIPAVNDVYEPGSVFKIVTMAAALDARVVTPETTVMDTGSFAYAGGVVRNSVAWPPGLVTMTQVLQRSSNVGAAQVGVMLGTRRFYEYVAAFGFGRPTGIELPGEAAGLVKRPGQTGWDDYDLVANSFGQGIAVTPLQMAAAVAAIANGGTLLKPYVVAQVRGPALERTYYPAVVRQVVRAETARRLTEMLVATVEHVEGDKPRLSKVPGHRVAGKTGTSEVPRAHGYDRSATIASFVGYAPADDPRFVVLVKIDEPQDSPWGETVAAPLFRSIAQQLLVYFRVAPSESQASKAGR